jgi:AraC-like DNA-binding protein
MSTTRVYGDAVAHSFGLQNAPIVTATIRNSCVAISRLSIGADHFGMSLLVPPEDTFVVAIHLTAVPRHEMWSRGRPAIVRGYAPGAMRTVNLIDEYSTCVRCPHEALSCYLPRSTLNEFCDEAGLPRVGNLMCDPGIIDPVMVHLCHVLLPAFQRPARASTLFLDHVTFALLTHLCSKYSGVRTDVPHPKGGMTRLQANRAKEFLAGHCADDFPLLAVARACGLSKGHFIKAFRISTGLTPYQWLQRHRVDRAKDLLRDPGIAIAEVAVACGFADQSHLTRVFSRTVGRSPAAWRRDAGPRAGHHERVQGTPEASRVVEVRPDARFAATLAGRCDGQGARDRAVVTAQRCQSDPR